MELFDLDNKIKNILPEKLYKCICGEEFLSRSHSYRYKKKQVYCKECLAKTKAINLSKALRKYSNQEVLEHFYYKMYKSSAKIRKIGFNMSFDLYKEVASKNCIYCGEPPLKRITKSLNKRLIDPKIEDLKFLNGIDRIDSSKDYELNNIQACCEICNKAKRDLTLEDFKSWIQKLIKNNNGTI